MLDLTEEKTPSDGLKLLEPASESDWTAYFELRWRVLRQPWGQPHGSERDELDPSAYHLMLRTKDGSAAAIGRLHLNSSAEAQVRYMAVDDSWRSKGLGSRILIGLEAQAALLSVKRIILNSREQAIDFYKRHGYGLGGDAETLFGEVRHVRMQKDLIQED
jgi:predicted GNAT family N-acyltransferase